ncbi:Pre-mRNA-processing factor 31 [Nakaseomyces bracarensis]|uniref:Pre-mRNA-processing factor 31 n=1 Tax=Nakaseomyces bracarensis TaxID=273131 RepID=A0ABR4NR84_9SACH
MSDADVDDFFKDLDDDFDKVEEEQLVSEESKTVIEPNIIDNIFLDINTIDEALSCIEKGISNRKSINDFLPIPRAMSLESVLRNYNGLINSEYLGIINKILNYAKEAESVASNNISDKYKIIFPELISILSNPYQYAKFVELLEFTSSEAISQVVPKFESLFNINKELSLVLSISLNTDFNRGDKVLDDETRREISMLIVIITELHEIDVMLTSRLSAVVLDIAPNLCSLIGQETTTQLIYHTGSLLQLSKIPSCNLENIGGKNMKENKSGTVNNYTKHRGYIWHSDIIQQQPYENHKQLIRMLCSKISLAARVDAGQQGPSKNCELGIKWRKEILDKIVKIKNPPNLAEVKALPVPEDQPKKKRAGRKFRKYKEQFKLSKSRQLQNRMEFGKQEKTVLDAYGEEVGLGMSNSRLGRASSSIPTTTAKVSKTLKRKLNEVNSTTQEYFNTIQERTNSSSVVTSNEENKKSKATNHKDWYQNHL